MRKVYEILELPKPTKGDVGVEIEVEGAGIQTHVSEVWRYEDDGSLRGAFPGGRCEFIFQKPILVGEVQAAIEELAAVQKKGKAKLNFSFRTSVHVHVNVQELTYNQVCNMIYIYLLAERMLSLGILWNPTLGLENESRRLSINPSASARRRQKRLPIRSSPQNCINGSNS